MKIKDLLEDSQRICSLKNKLGDLPVAKDIARLAKKFTININNDVHEFHECKNNQEALFHILSILGTQLQNVSISKDAYEAKCNFDDHYSISGFIVDEFGENGLVSSLLKTIHQTIVARVLHRVKDTLMADSIPMQIRDSRGQWKIHIIMEKDKQGNLAKLKSVHERKEIAYQRVEGVSELIDLFEFSWEYVQHLNISTGVVTSVEMNLLDTGSKNVYYANILRNLFVNSLQNIDSCYQGGRKPLLLVCQDVISSRRVQLLLVGLCLSGVVWILKKIKYF